LAKKEKEEQQLVTDYIVDIISNSVSKVQTSIPETIKAGNLLHLKTVIQGTFDSKHQS
jgi:isochorismate synthase